MDQRATLARCMAQIAAGLPELERAAQADRTAGLQAGAPLSSTEALPTETVGAYRRIRLRIALSAPLPAVVGLMQALDQARPRMLVDDLQLRAAPVLARRDNPPLDISMLVVSFRLAEPAS